MNYFLAELVKLESTAKGSTLVVSSLCEDFDGEEREFPRQSSAPVKPEEPTLGVTSLEERFSIGGPK